MNVTVLKFTDSKYLADTAEHWFKFFDTGADYTSEFSTNAKFAPCNLVVSQLTLNMQLFSHTFLRIIGLYHSYQSYRYKKLLLLWIFASFRLHH